jgi:hypothetical protein
MRCPVTKAWPEIYAQNGLSSESGDTRKEINPGADDGVEEYAIVDHARSDRFLRSLQIHDPIQHANQIFKVVAVDLF